MSQAVKELQRLLLPGQSPPGGEGPLVSVGPALFAADGQSILLIDDSPEIHAIVTKCTMAAMRGCRK